MRCFFYTFVIPKIIEMNAETTILPVWYGGGRGNTRNVFDKRRTPKLLRALYYPKLSYYEYKKNQNSTRSKRVVK